MGCTNNKTKYLADSDSQSDADVYTKNKAPYELKAKPVRILGDSNNFLTEKQKVLVRETWNLIKEDKIEKGSKIFIRIFHKKPEIKLLFPFHDMSDEEVMCNPLFRSHGLRFMMAVQTTVENLDALDLFLVPNLIQLGRKHVYVTDKFTVYEKIFRQSIIEIFEEELGKITFSYKIKESWILLFGFITEKLMEGYFIELEENSAKTKNPATNAATNEVSPIKHFKGYHESVEDMETENIATKEEDKMEDGSDRLPKEAAIDNDLEDTSEVNKTDGYTTSHLIKDVDTDASVSDNDESMNHGEIVDDEVIYDPSDDPIDFIDSTIVKIGDILKDKTIVVPIIKLNGVES